jgi:hypothetical protein
MRGIGRGRWVLLLAAVALSGCRSLTKPQPVAPAPVPAPAPAPAEPAKAAEPAKVQTEAEAGPEPKAKLTGVTLELDKGLSLLRPDGWREADKVEGGPLVKLLRGEPIGNVTANVSLAAATDPSLPAGATPAMLKDAYVTNLKTELAQFQPKVVTTRETILGGQPALAVILDFDKDGQPVRAKQVLTALGQTVYTLQGVGPREAFEKQFEPEFNAIAATVTLPRE